MTEELIRTGVTLIPPQGAPTRLEYAMPADPGYRQLKEIMTPLLNGGYLERVRVLVGGAYTDMFVDEDSQGKDMLVNARATEIYRANWMTQHPDCDPDELPDIKGPAILFDRPVWF